MKGTVEQGAWRGMAVVGIVARTHGRRGAVVVNPETDFPEERFRAGSELFFARRGEPAALRIREARFRGGRPVVSFERVETIDEAERLRGAELRVPEDALHPLPAGAWYEHELVGCAVRTVGGEDVGAVGAVEGPSGAKRLIVQGAGGEVDVPFVAGICVSIDPGAGSILVDPPDGLLDVNRTRGRKQRGGQGRRRRKFGQAAAKVEHEARKRYGGQGRRRSPAASRAGTDG